MGNGCHIRAVGFEYDTAEGNGSREVVRQVAFLEREHAADAQHEALEGEQLACLDLIAGETMEHASRQVVFVAPQDLHHFVLCPAAVYHERQTCLYRPAHLFLECL